MPHQTELDFLSLPLTKNDEDAIIYDGPAKFSKEEHNYTCHCTIRLHKHLNSYISTVTSLPVVDHDEYRSLIKSEYLGILKINGLESHPVLSRSYYKYASGESVEVESFYDNERQLVFFDESSCMTRIDFRIFNFIQDGIPSRKIEHEATKETNPTNSSGINIEIKPSFFIHSDLSHLKRASGFIQTHTVSIEKSDFSCFSLKEAEEYLNIFKYLFSFAAGYWCGPVCAAGISKNGNKSLQILNPPFAAWQKSQTWCYTGNTFQIRYALNRFIQKMLDERWKPILKKCIGLYTKANQTKYGFNSGILLIQAALEALSFDILVNKEKSISARGFRNLPASDKIRLLLSNLSIPLRLPESETSLIELSESLHWDDAPRGFTEIRNSLVHPEHKHLQLITEYALSGAWRLGMWYLELCLLRIFNYNQLVYNRVREGSDDIFVYPPWVKEATIVP